MSISFVGCKSNNKQKFTSYSFDYFDTVTTIVGYEKKQQEFDEICKVINKSLEEYHKLFDIYNTYDDIANLKTINTSDEAVTVDKKIIDLLIFGKDIYTRTDGKTNIALGSVLSIWHKYRQYGMSHPDQAELPKMSDLKIAANHCDIEKLIIDPENRTVFLCDKEILLDVGAIAKGYAVERIAELLNSLNKSGYVINIGGNVRVIGTKPNGQAFKVGIENPNADNQEVPHIAYLKIKDMSVVTSGSYQRFYTVGNKNYHHIIDPQTLIPAEYFKSVSVICKDSGLADAISTALFSMSYEQGLDLLNRFDGVEAMWVMPDGKQHYSKGFKQFLTDL